MVRDVQIVFKFVSNGKTFRHEFKNIHVFRNYLHDLPERAVQVGYFKEIPQHRVRQNYVEVYGCQIILLIDYNNTTEEIAFADASLFAQFLKLNSEIAEKIGYHPKFAS